MTDFLDDVSPAKVAAVREGLSRLTLREREILRHAIQGETASDSAVSMGISRRTVQRRLDRMMALAGVDTRTGLAYQAAKRGWI